MFHSLARHLTTSAHHSAVFCPEDNRFSITSACMWAAALVREHVRSSIITCVCVCVWLVPVCLWTASLYIYWNEQGSQGPLCRAPARSHASVYRLPWIKAWLRQPSPTAAPERWPARRQSSAGEDWVSSPGCRLGGPSSPARDMKGWNDTVSLYMLRNTRRVCHHIQSPNRQSCHIWQVLKIVHTFKLHYTCPKAVLWRKKKKKSQNYGPNLDSKQNSQKTKRKKLLICRKIK